MVKDNDNNEKLTITIKPYEAIEMWNVFSVVSSVGCVSFPQLAVFRFLSWPHFVSSVGCELTVIDILIAV